MSAREYCGNCRAELAYKGQVCTNCGGGLSPFKESKKSPILHYFFFIPYLVLEFWGFTYCIG